MRTRTVLGSVISGVLLTGTFVVAPALAANAAPKPVTYKNCAALNRVYPHGVGRSGARDKVSSRSKPVTTFTRNTKVYNLNKKSDRDKDGVACEKR